MKLVKKKILNFLMYLDPDDLGIGKELIDKGIRERFSVAVMKKILRPHMDVLDIGANIGFYAFIEAKKVNKVYAVEPVEYNFNLLKKNIALNGFDNIDTYRLAIGKESGTAKIYTSKRCNWATIVDKKDRTDDYAQRWDRFKKGSESVELLSLDDFVNKYTDKMPDLIRMDVEGAEVDIISGGAKTLSNMSDGAYLVVEIHSSCIKDKKSIAQMLDIIFGAGFKCVKVVNRLKELPIGKIADIKDFLTYRVGCPQVFFKK